MDTAKYSVSEAVQDVDTPIYEPPFVVDLGAVREVTLGSSSADTADMNVARYN